MKVSFLKHAQFELDDSVEWYNNQFPGLGKDFLDEIDIAIRRIKAFPDSCEILDDGLRRCIVKRFPFGLIYGIDGETIVIVAVAHLHREPGYWYNR